MPGIVATPVRQTEHLHSNTTTSSRAPSHRRVVIAFAAATCVSAPVALLASFSGFQPYDDEGYFLITVRSYLAGHALFTDVVTTYGPIYYEVMRALFAVLGQAPTHEGGRWVTFVVWVLAGVTGGAAAYRLTRNLWIGLGAQLLTLRVLLALAAAPMHPSDLASLLLVGLVLAATFRGERPRLTAVLIGAIVGALCMIKINVGGFAGVAVGFAAILSFRPPWRRLLTPPAVLGLFALPFLLMAPLLTRGWVLDFALVAALAAVAVGLASFLALPAERPPSSVGWLTAGGATLVAASVAVTLAGGTNLADVFDLLVTTPSRLPQLFVLPVDVGAGGVVSAAVLLVLSVAGFRWRGSSGVARGVIAIVAGLAIWVGALLLPTPLFVVTLPLAWIATQAPDDGEDNRTCAYARQLIPALAVMESLQAYPVAGTQLYLAALILVSVGALSINDGIRRLSRAELDYAARPAWPAAGVAPAALLVNVAFFALIALEVTAGFVADQPLGLPGAGLVRVPAQQGSDLRALVSAIDQHCSSFIAYPAMSSLYVWTGHNQAPPEQLYVSSWMFFLDSAQQESLVRQLQDRPRLCVVKNQAVIDFWAEGRTVPARPLVEFIDSEFVPAGSFGDYQLLVRS